MSSYVIAKYRHDTGLRSVADLAPGHHILCVGDDDVFTLPLPDVAPGESLRLTRTETGWEVRQLQSYLLTVPADAMCWADAPEQDGDR